MKKIGIILATVVMMLLFAFSASALESTGQCGDNVYWNYNNETSEIVISGTGDMWNFDYYQSPSPFYLSSIKKATILNGVTSIGSQAFYDCTSLISVEIPDSVTKISGSAFTRCKSLTSVVVPNSVTTIEAFAFSGCPNLVSVTLPNEITTIDSETFYRCTSLTSIEIPDSVTNICFGAFLDCENLVSVKLSDNINTIGEQAFNGCSSLKYVFCTDLNFDFSGKSIDNYNTKLKNAIWHYGATNHTPSEWIIDTDSTCTEKGSKHTECIICDIRMNEESIYEKPHQTQWVDISTPTCLENGMRIKKCFVCNNEIEIEVVPANGHSYISETKKTATCTDTGIMVFTCSCGETYTETLENLGHSYSSSFTIDVAATCTTDGSKSKHCTRSGCTAKTSVTTIVATGHSHGSYKTIKNATCTSAGSKQRTCSACGNVEISTIAKLSHDYKTTTTKTTLSKNGSVVTACSVCGTKKSTTTIYYPKSIKLSATSYTYNGKSKTPSVIVKDSKGNVLKKNKDYTVSYAKGRKTIGKYTVTITFKGNYSGTKKLTFEIVPAKVTLSKLTSESKQLIATWKSVSGITGYEVQYSTSKKFTSKTTKTVKIKSAKAKKTTIKKLKKGKKYYVRIRAYKTINKKPIYGAWSSVKSVKIK